MADRRSRMARGAVNHRWHERAAAAVAAAAAAAQAAIMSTAPGRLSADDVFPGFSHSTATTASDG